MENTNPKMENTLIGKYAGHEMSKTLIEKYNKRYFILTLHTHSYAEGITGTSHYAIVYTNEDLGFKFKKDATPLLKELKKSHKTIIHRETRGYGDIADRYKHAIVSNIELSEFILNNNYPIYSITIK